MLFVTPDGCEAKVKLVNDRDNIVVTIEDENGDTHTVEFDVVKISNDIVILTSVSERIEEVLKDWQCLAIIEDDVHDEILQFIIKSMLQPLSAEIKSGVLMTTLVNNAKDSTHAFFVAPNAVILDINWPFGEFRDEDLKIIYFTKEVDENRRYIFDCLSKHYDIISQDVQHASKLLSRKKE